jgi:TRAP-type C4-dicarboxylate transport system permease small subunit
MQQFIRILDMAAGRASSLLAWLAGLVLLATMTLACANMIMRGLATSIKGTVELVGFLGAVLAAFSLGYTQMHKGHIAVGILAGRLPRRLRRALDGLQHAASCVFFLWAGLETTRWGLTLIASGELSETLRIIYHPFVFCCSLGCACIALVLLRDALGAFFPPPAAGAQGRQR